MTIDEIKKASPKSFVRFEGMDGKTYYTTVNGSVYFSFDSPDKREYTVSFGTYSKGKGFEKIFSYDGVDCEDKIRDISHIFEAHTFGKNLFYLDGDLLNTFSLKGYFDDNPFIKYTLIDENNVRLVSTDGRNELISKEKFKELEGDDLFEKIDSMSSLFQGYFDFTDCLEGSFDSKDEKIIYKDESGHELMLSLDFSKDDQIKSKKLALFDCFLKLEKEGGYSSDFNLDDLIPPTEGFSDSNPENTDSNPENTDSNPGNPDNHTSGNPDGNNPGGGSASHGNHSGTNGYVSQEATLDAIKEIPNLSNISFKNIKGRERAAKVYHTNDEGKPIYIDNNGKAMEVTDVKGFVSLNDYLEILKLVPLTNISGVTTENKPFNADIIQTKKPKEEQQLRSGIVVPADTVPNERVPKHSKIETAFRKVAVGVACAAVLVGGVLGLKGCSHKEIKNIEEEPTTSYSDVVEEQTTVQEKTTRKVVENTTEKEETTTKKKEGRIINNNVLPTEKHEEPTVYNEKNEIVTVPEPTYDDPTYNVDPEITEQDKTTEATTETTERETTETHGVIDNNLPTEEFKPAIDPEEDEDVATVPFEQDEDPTSDSGNSSNIIDYILDREKRKNPDIQTEEEPSNLIEETATLEETTNAYETTEQEIPDVGSTMTNNETTQKVEEYLSKLLGESTTDIESTTYAVTTEQETSSSEIGSTTLNSNETTLISDENDRIIDSNFDFDFDFKNPNL